MKAQRNKGLPLLAALAMVALLLSACAPAAAPAPAPPTPTARPVVTPPTPTPTLAPTPAVVRPVPTPTAGSVVEKPRYGGVLTLAIAGDIGDFDPHKISIALLADVGLANYSNLVWFDPEDMTHTRIIGDVARSWEASPDGMSYTFHLPKGVKFHDGHPLTAADVKFSLDRIAFPPKGMPSPWKEDLYALKSVDAPDDYTVKITLTYPSASFMSFLAGPYVVIVPKHLFEKEGDDALRKKPLGSGPFVFKEYIRGVSYEMVRNPNYYKTGVPYLDGVKAFIIKDNYARLAALRTRQVLALKPHTAPISAAERAVLLKELGEKVVSDVMYRDSIFTVFILNNKWKPLDDVRVRQALALGVNKQALFDVVFQGLGRVSGPMAAGGPWALPKAELETYAGYEPDMKARIARARELLAGAGYPDGFELEILARSDSTQVRQVEYLVTELPKIGIKVRAKIMEQAAFFNDLNAGIFQASGYVLSSTSGDPDSVIGTFYITQGGKNWARMSDPRIDELFDKQARALDPQQRKEIVWEIQRILLRNAYSLVFGLTPYIGAWYRSVRGNIELDNVARHNVKYENVWLAE